MKNKNDLVHEWLSKAFKDKVYGENMIQSKKVLRQSVAQLPKVNSGNLKSVRGSGKKTLWERDLVLLQKKLRKCAGTRNLTEELIRECKNES